MNPRGPIWPWALQGRGPFNYRTAAAHNLEMGFVLSHSVFRKEINYALRQPPLPSSFKAVLLFFPLLVDPLESPLESGLSLLIGECLPRLELDAVARTLALL